MPAPLRLIAQGVEAGGHVFGTTPLAELIAQVSKPAGVPVAAAGGIVDGGGRRGLHLRSARPPQHSERASCDG